MRSSPSSGLASLSISAINSGTIEKRPLKSAQLGRGEQGRPRTMMRALRKQYLRVDYLATQYVRRGGPFLRNVAVAARGTTVHVTVGCNGER